MKSTTITNAQSGGNDVLQIEFEQENDGRWIAEISALSGVMAYGATREEAQAKVEALALRTLADRLDHGETIPELGGTLLRQRMSHLPSDCNRMTQSLWHMTGHRM